MRELQKNLGASLVETFSVEQINQHLSSAQQDMARLTAPRSTGGGATAAHATTEEPCPVCRNTHTLRFEPHPKNCITCGQRIKRNGWYYVNAKPDAVWCQNCFNGAGEDLHVENVKIKKIDVADHKHRNEMNEDEAWVECDNPECGKWVHMICGLFNKVRIAAPSVELLSEFVRYPT